MLDKNKYQTKLNNEKVMKAKKSIGKFLQYFVSLPIVIILLVLYFSEVNFLLFLKVLIPIALLSLLFLLGIHFFRVRKDKLKLKALENKPNKGLDDRIEIGYAAFNAKELGKAYTVFERIKKEYPNRPAGFCGLGIVEFERKNYDNAKSNLQKSLELDSKYKIAKEFLDKIEKLNKKGDS